MQFSKYAIGSAIGILPGVALYVAIGRLASSIAEVSSGEMQQSSNPVIVFVTVGVSIVILVILVVLLTRYAKKALKDQLELLEQEQANATANEAAYGAADDVADEAVTELAELGRSTQAEVSGDSDSSLGARQQSDPAPMQIKVEKRS